VYSFPLHYQDLLLFLRCILLLEMKETVAIILR
jgi:hypothetical protein